VAFLFRCVVRRRFAASATSLLCATALAACTVTPEPLTGDQLKASATAVMADAYDGQEPVRGTIDLGEAMGRAVLYNLDGRVQQADEVLRSRELTVASLAMLPGLAVNAGYAGRDSYDASSSRNITTGRTETQTSTSQDRDIRTADAALSWNVLDLGLSWVRAKQAADSALASRELRRRVLAKVVEDVRSAYWKALAAEYLARDLAKLEARARTSLAQSRTLIDNGNVSPLAALGFQKEIYELQDRLQTVEAEVLSARAQLASLMNLPPGTRFTLVRPRSDGAPRLPAEETMLRQALEERPEMREALYDARSAGLNATAALIETLPGISAFVGPNFTSNSFTANANWTRWGAQASWNLLKVFSLPARQDAAEAREALAQEKVKALAASLALQVVVSRQRYAHAQRRLDTAKQARDVQDEILRQLSVSATAARSGDQELVREEMAALLARARHDVAVAEVQSAYAVAQTTMGRDPYPEFEPDSDLPSIAAAFRKRLAGKAAAPPAPFPLAKGASAAAANEPAPGAAASAPATGAGRDGGPSDKVPGQAGLPVAPGGADARDDG
jgi:outer membrane protein TolC